MLYYIVTLQLLDKLELGTM